MDWKLEHRGTTFIWHAAKAAENLLKHGVSFEEAATVFDDPLFVVQDASRNDEERHAAIGISSDGRLLTVVHVEHSDFIRLVSARRNDSARSTLCSMND